MGYNTEFNGSFELNKKLDDETFNLLKGLNVTRRMKRDMKKLFPYMSDDEILSKYGIEGEFYVDGEGFCGQDMDKSILNNNSPASTQPSLWCQWVPTDDGMYIEWDGGEKAYEMDEWIKYIINKILAPRGYVLNGEVEAQGEESDDKWKIVITDNNVQVKYGHFVWD